MSTTEQPHVDRLVADADTLGPAALPRRNGELVFEAPWESRAFGVAVALAQERAGDWEAFRTLLIEEIAAWENDHTGGDWSYYERWLASLERLLQARGLVTEDELRTRTRRLEHEERHEHDHEHGRAHDHDAH